MKITFIGVGEACDPQLPNTSILLQTGAGSNSKEILLDCGFTTPHLYFNSCSDPEQLDALWISHFHGDHFFGVPLLLLRFWEMGRRKPLAVLGQKDVKEKVLEALELAFPGFARKLQFAVESFEIEPGKIIDKFNFQWRTAENDHSQRSLSLRIDAEGKSLFYSGDGRPTSDTLKLAAGCDLVIHEAFRVRENTPGHGSIRGCLDFGRHAGVKNLALVHVQREDRQKFREDILEMIAHSQNVTAFLPEPGEQFVI